MFYLLIDLGSCWIFRFTKKQLSHNHKIRIQKEIWQVIIRIRLLTFSFGINSAS